MDNKKLMRKRLPPISEGPYKQQKLYIREIDKAYIMLGLKPSKYWKQENE
jgi:hypothetical protein